MPCQRVKEHEINGKCFQLKTKEFKKRSGNFKKGEGDNQQRGRMAKEEQSYPQGSAVQRMPSFSHRGQQVQVSKNETVQSVRGLLRGHELP